MISCDYQGEKGHPDAKVLERMKEAEIKVFRTDEQGTIVAVSDGENIAWNQSPSESWQAGKQEKQEEQNEIEKMSADTADTEKVA